MTRRAATAHVVNLEQLPQDLSEPRDAPPTTSSSRPNLCNDGHDAPCVDGRPGWAARHRRVPRKWVPLIMRSPPSGGRPARDHLRRVGSRRGRRARRRAAANSRCRGRSIRRASAAPGEGASARWCCRRSCSPGTVSQEPYNHYSLLRTIEAIFALPPLGYAASAAGQGLWRGRFQRERAACTRSMSSSISGLRRNGLRKRRGGEKVTSLPNLPG